MDSDVSIFASNKTNIMNLGHVTDMKFHPLNTEELWLADKDTDSFVIFEMDAKTQKLNRGKYPHTRTPAHAGPSF